ncbi:hypothetical protein [Nocardiopsis tropica]|uniref:Uncharacterized protein n=1 Tax=Nocardiopsis tropica TaxID=109330 RepID=A0ABV2A4V0_9ACTN|nr:hypothetical protein [Nocardiopsis tropica]
MSDNRDGARGRRARKRAECCSAENGPAAEEARRNTRMLLLTALGVVIAAAALAVGVGQWYTSARPTPGSDSDRSTLQVNITVQE